MTETEELNRFRCLGSDGRLLIVVNYQFFETVRTESGIRKRPGAIRLELENGEAVRHISATCFEVIGTGELVEIDGRIGVSVLALHAPGMQAPDDEADERDDDDADDEVS